MIEQQYIIPALIPQSAESLIQDIKTLDFAHELQIDVVDGKFVDQISWPYEPYGQPDEVKSTLSDHSFEVDMMVSDQVLSAESWVKAGAQTVIFHLEGVQLFDVKHFANRFTEVSIGVAINNQTPLDLLNPYLGFVDMVQLMGIEKIGAQGASFDERVLGRIAELRNVNPNLLISVDGSMNENTLPLAKQAGADRFVVGSALLRALDREQQFQKLTNLINQTVDT